MSQLKEKTINDFLKEQLIEFSLKTNNKEMFLKLTDPNWEQYFKNDIQEVEQNKKQLLLRLDYMDDSNFDVDFERYIEQTTLAFEFNKKKKILKEILLASNLVNSQIFKFISKIYRDYELIHLVTIVSDKRYRNSVFYRDEDSERLLIKDTRGDVQKLDPISALEYYRKHNEEYFIEVKIMQ